MNMPGIETLRKYLLAVALFWSATGERLGNIPLLVFAAVVLFDPRLWREALKSSNFKGWALICLPSAVLFLYNLSYFLTSDAKGAADLVQVRVAFGLIPTVLFLLGDRLKLWGRDFLLGSIALGLLVTALYGFGLSWWRAEQGVEPTQSFADYFFYDRYSFPLGWHPAYMSLFAGLLMLWFALKRFSPPPALAAVKLRSGLGLLFFSALFFILQGRMNWIALMLSVPVALIAFRRELITATVSPKVGLAALLGFGLSLTLFALKAPDSIRSRWAQGLSTTYDLSSEDIEDFSGFTIRLAEWQGVRHALTRAPIFGYGGNAQAELEKSYDEIGFVLGQKNRYNAHSMYYQSLLEGGWTGFFVLLLFILGMLTYAIRNRDPLLFAAVLFFALSGLTESLIDRQKGVLFAAVILPILAASFDARSLQSGQRKS